MNTPLEQTRQARSVARIITEQAKRDNDAEMVQEAGMISDQDRQIAEDTFGLIERTTKPELDRSFLHADTRDCPDCSEPQHLVSGGHENGEPWWSWMHDTALAAMQCPGLSGSARPSDVVNAQAPLLRAAVAACTHPVDDDGECGRSECEPDVSMALAEPHRFHDGESCFPGCPAYDSKLDVSMALAEHTANAIDKILGA